MPIGCLTVDDHWLIITAQLCDIHTVRWKDLAAGCHFLRVTEYDHLDRVPSRLLGHIAIFTGNFTADLRCHEHRLNDQQQ